MELFSIACTTCKSKLKVRDTAAIGQILGCPKCGSMVLVAPPAGWQMPTPPPSLAATPDPAAVTSAPVGPWRNDSSEFGPAIGAATIPANVPAFADSPPPWPAWLPWACVPAAALLSAVGVWVWLETAKAEVTPADAAQHVAAVVEPSASTPTEPVVASSQLPVASPEPQAPRSEPTAPATSSSTVVETPVPSQPQPTSPSLQSPTSSLQPVQHDPFAPVKLPAKPVGSVPASPVSPSPTSSEPTTVVPPAAVPPAVTAPTPSLQPPVSSLQPVLDPLPPVDVMARLADPLPAIEFRDARLTQFLAFWSQASTVPVVLDIESMLDVGMRPTDAITLKLRDATLGDALAEALAERRLASVVQNGSILITPAMPDPHTAETVTYDVTSLVREDALGLVQLVRQCVEPTSWAEVGGPGSAAYEKGKLVIHHRPAVQRQVARLLDRLRLARGESPQSKLDPRRLSLDVRSAQAKAKLAVPVTANHIAPLPLERIVDKLASSAGVDVIYDEPAMAAVGRRRDPDASLVAANVPLGDAMDKLLAPLGLTCVAVDDRTLLVTSRRAAGARLETEFYRVGDLVMAGKTPEKLMEQLKAAVGAAWNEVGPHALVRFDAHASCLIVHQSQAIQRQIEALLAAMHHEPSTKN